MRASVIACSTVPGPDSGSICQPCTHWPSGMLGCWARSLAGCYTPACGDLSGYSAYLFLFYLSAFICLLTCLVTSYWQSVLSFWQTTLSCLHGHLPSSCSFFCLSSCLSVLLQRLPSCHSFLLAALLLSVYLPCRLSCRLASQPGDVWKGAG